MLKWNKVLAIIIAVIEAIFPFIVTDDVDRTEQKQK